MMSDDCLFCKIINGDIPADIVEKFMRIHKGRVKSAGPITDQEQELDSTIRNWNRTQDSDPYKFGLESLAAHLKPFLKEYIIRTAYNEFCFPTIDEAVDRLVQEKISRITIITTMVTRGGSHSEIEIPEEVNALSSKYKDVEIQYAWPFDMDNFASFLSSHVKSFDSSFSTISL